MGGYMHVLKEQYLDRMLQNIFKRILSKAEEIEYNCQKHSVTNESENGKL